MTLAAHDDLVFLRAYESATLMKPQIVADNVLTGIFLADTSHRAALSALLLQESVEAARRLAAVWHALADRSRPIVAALSQPLPDAARWDAFAQAVADAAAPAALLRAINVDDSAMQSAEEMLEFAGLSWFANAIRTFEAGPPAVTLAPAEAGTSASIRVRGTDRAGTPAETTVWLEDDRVIALGDATGDFVTWSRDFIGAYIDARESAGR
jgi:hypothetical protein